MNFTNPNDYTTDRCSCDCPLLDGACTHCDLTPPPFREITRADIPEREDYLPPRKVRG